MANTTVDLPTLGTLRGNQAPQGVRQFLNVPYALIPARWRAPAKLTANNPWPNGRDAQTFGSVWPTRIITEDISLFILKSLIRIDHSALSLQAHLSAPRLR